MWTGNFTDGTGALVDVKKEDHPDRLWRLLGAMSEAQTEYGGLAACPPGTINKLLGALHGAYPGIAIAQTPQEYTSQVAKDTIRSRFAALPLENKRALQESLDSFNAASEDAPIGQDPIMPEPLKGFLQNCLGDSNPDKPGFRSRLTGEGVWNSLKKEVVDFYSDLNNLIGFIPTGKAYAQEETGRIVRNAFERLPSEAKERLGDAFREDAGSSSTGAERTEAERFLNELKTRLMGHFQTEGAWDAFPEEFKQGIESHAGLIPVLKGIVNAEQRRLEQDARTVSVAA